ncbi:hypothetical protein [Pseudomonas sp. 210_17 TE3656]
MYQLICKICRLDAAQDLTEPDGPYSAVCATCGPYALDAEVEASLGQGRLLDADAMKEWIANEYDPNTNPRPVITKKVAIWLN